MSPRKKIVSSKQIALLNKKIKEQDKIIKVYKKVLKESDQKIKAISEDLQENFNLIRKIHLNLIPSDLPKIPHFRLSYKFVPTNIGVSGDFFDIIQLKDPLKFGIILSSCSTYTLTSLFLSTILKSSGKLNQIKTSKDFMQYLSEKFKSSLPEKESLHLFFGIVDRRRFTLDYCVLGNVFAGLKRNGRVSSFKSSSKSLHKNLKAPFFNKKIDLHPNDVLTFCSPGIVNRVNKKQDIFGEKRLLKSIPKNSLGVLEIRQNVLFQARQFGKGQSPLQDQTILVMEVKDRIIRLTKKT